MAKILQRCLHPVSVKTVSDQINRRNDLSVDHILGDLLKLAVLLV